MGSQVAQLLEGRVLALVALATTFAPPWAGLPCPSPETIGQQMQKNQQVQVRRQKDLTMVPWGSHSPRQG